MLQNNKKTQPTKQAAQNNASKWLLLSLQLNHTRNKLAVNWLDSLVVDFQSDPMIACYEGSTKNYEFLGAS